MKRTQTSILLTALFGLLSINSLIAQYGYGSQYGRGGQYGRGSRLPQVQDTPKKEEPLTVEELVDNEMPSISQELQLDPFEEAVVRTTFIKYVQQRKELRILELEPEKMREELERLEKEQNEEMKAGLPEEKYEAYLELVKNKFKTKKKKKKKKKSKE
ncbi:MAG: hypothetical protein ABJN84_10890 [Flavobacteriaceae bacterium]